ncbi:MAG: helix-turn-helix domain-containing protein [Marinisporobacter sp.]|jgi:transcriptional regulator with XRE-family HTH domain|nr:helix-turn-helix domain-containing protein [Marinisporobacter sp.]
MNKFPEKLKKLRNELGLSQQNLSTSLNIPRTTISSWESGSRTPELLTMEKLADFFKVSIDYLLGKTDSRNPVHTETIVQNIYQTIQDDPELADFIEKLSHRRDLHILSKKTKDLSPHSIYRLIRVLDALEADNNPIE